jgi:hypothetical protein
MPVSHPDALALLRLHVEAGWDVRLPPLMPSDVELLPGGSRSPWAHYLAETAAGRVRIWRPDVPAEQRALLGDQVADALARRVEASAAPGITREVALHLAAPPGSGATSAAGLTRRIEPHERALLDAFEPGEVDYYAAPARQPVFGVILGGHLVSVAHSSRRTPEACELGINTLPKARRRGYALAATVRWTQAILEEGLVPLYSALAENAASLALAAAAGYRPFARAAYIAG